MAAPSHICIKICDSNSGIMTAWQNKNIRFTTSTEKNLDIQENVPQEAVLDLYREHKTNDFIWHMVATLVRHTCETPGTHACSNKVV